MPRSDLGLPSGKFIFLSFLDVLSVPKRKNLEGVIAAFRKSGVARQGGHLVLKINNGRHLPSALDRLREECGDLDVTIINETWNRQQVNSLIATCDCLVSLHRAEGFGLTIAEAMHLGRPVITTAYSGNMDYTHHNTAMLVDYSLVEVGVGAEPYPPSSHWAEPDMDIAAEWMKRVQCDVAFRARIAKCGQNYVREHLSPSVVGALIRARIEHMNDIPTRCDRDRGWAHVRQRA